MLRVNFLIRHTNPLDRVRAAARDAAEREAAFQLEASGPCQNHRLSARITFAINAIQQTHS
jgi:hypothetical protein